MIEKLALKTPGGKDFEINPPKGVNMPSGGLSDFKDILSWGTTMFLIAAVIIAVFILILAGIQWTTSGGDKEKVQSARNKIVYTIIGLIIIFGAFMIINIIGFLFDVNFFS
jgi:hypothetical protein